MPQTGTLTLDELSARTGVPPRTIRLYQTRGLLPLPRRAGRAAAYGADHVVRLELVLALARRGLRLRAIQDLLADHPEGDVTVRDWIGDADRPPSPSRPREQASTYRVDEVRTMLEGRPAGTLDALVRAEVLVRHPSGYLAPSPTLLEVALRLQSAGIPLDTTLAAGNVLRQRLAEAARQLVALFGDQLGRDRRLGDLGAALDALRPAGAATVEVIFAEEVERAIGQRVGRPRQAPMAGTGRSPRSSAATIVPPARGTIVNRSGRPVRSAPAASLAGSGGAAAQVGVGPQDHPAAERE